MKILLSHGYFLTEDEVEKKIMMPYPPQGLLHICSYLRDNKIDSTIYDSIFHNYNELCAFLIANKPEYLGLYVNLMTRPNILKIIRFIRNTQIIKDITIILGGPDVRHHADLYLGKGADYCISGEGEEVLLQLITMLDKQEQDGINKIKGLTFISKENEIYNTGEQELIKSLDNITFPDFELIDIEKYFAIWKSHHGYSSISLSTMRGCPYSCKWCSKAVFGQSMRRRSAASVVKEMKRLKKLYNPDRYWIVDDVFTISKKWLTEFSSALKEEKIQVSYECITRADKMDEEIISLLKETGCFRVWIGAESGSQKVLDLMDRRVKAQTVRDMIIASRESGIETGTFLMLGYPGEDDHDILETIKHLKKASPDQITITISYPIPGTDFYDQVKNKGLIIPGEWGTYSDRELDFQRTYKNKYYYYAVRFINHEIKAHKEFKEKRIWKGVNHSVKSKIIRVLMIANRH